MSTLYYRHGGMMKSAIVIGAISLICASCATVSYAPPVTSANIGAGKNLADGIKLVDVFIIEYRKRAGGAANGRQYFDVPAIGAAIGAVAATAFGAGTDVTIAAGAVGALTGAGKTYYAPKAKAEIYSDGLNALLCIQLVALDLEPFSKDKSRISSLMLEEDLADARLYHVVKNAVLLTEGYVRTRLINAGSSPDVSSLTAELQAIIEERKKAEDAATKNANELPKISETLTTVTSEDRQNIQKALTLIPKLQECALRAKA